MIVIKSKKGPHGRDVATLDASALEKGDVVATVSSNYAGSFPTIYIVDRVTATQIVMTGEHSPRFRRDTGVKVGGRWSSRLLPMNDPDVLRALQGVTARNAAAQIEKLSAALADRKADSQRTLDLCAEISQVASEAADRLREIEATPRSASE
jgi:hypothetical protein